MTKKNESESQPTAGEPYLDRFIAELTRLQPNLRAYIVSAIGNHDDAADVLQRTNIVLWRNAASFRPEAEFMPWAITIAKYEILSYHRDRGRDKLVFSPDVGEMLLQTAQEEMGDLTARHEALRKCIKQLPERSREMVRLRYDAEKSMAQIAHALRKSENAVKCSFVRVRKALEECVDRRLKIEA